ncbi:hypothetical protein SDC9_102326 [bioreactor metagenome]|uniref:Uncharacterized protein n=1 Tax=bioreactor metagenome TaxID=1076179 RepID=A0A645AR20_9ZZZZ
MSHTGNILENRPKRCERRLRRRGFTLMEVVVALAILGMALAGFFAIAQSATRRADKAYQNWRQMHLLSQAAEYYLLFPDEEPPPMPTDIFNDPDYQIEASYSDAEGLADAYNNLEGQAPLRTLTLDLVRISDRQVVDSLKIDRIDYNTSGSD